MRDCLKRVSWTPLKWQSLSSRDSELKIRETPASCLLVNRHEALRPVPVEFNSRWGHKNWNAAGVRFVPRHRCQGTNRLSSRADEVAGTAEILRQESTIREPQPLPWGPTGVSGARAAMTRSSAHGRPAWLGAAAPHEAGTSDVEASQGSRRNSPTLWSALKTQRRTLAEILPNQHESRVSPNAGPSRYSSIIIYALKGITIL